MAFHPVTPGVIAAAGAGGVPVGTIISFAGSVAPAGGWLVCDGSLYSKTDETYKQLYNVIKETYNQVGDTENLFRVPDLRGRFIRGTGTDGSADMSPAEFGKKQNDGYQNHNHTISFNPYSMTTNRTYPTTVIITKWTAGIISRGVLIDDGVNNAASTDTEVRPFNLRLRWYIKQ